MRVLRRGAVAVVVAMSVGLLAPGPASPVPQWAPAAAASVHPGVQTFTEGAQCTANFVFYDDANVYIGQAAHCSGTGGATETDGCTAESLPVGTPVTVSGASQPATLVYNSWRTMQALGETDADACQYNDLALLRLAPADVGKVNPSVPFWGGPGGLNTVGTSFGQHVYSYGNSELRLGLAVLGPKKGISLGDEGGGWAHLVTTVTPGIPGDSGSPYLDARGRALGVLSTLAVGVPGGVSNVVGDLAHQLGYMRAHVPSFGLVQLATGTVAFNGSRLPLGVGLALG
jgi:hypothetical protein